MSSGLPAIKVTMFHFLAVITPGYLFVLLTVMFYGQELEGVSAAVYVPTGEMGIIFLAVLFLVSGPVIGYAIYAISVFFVPQIYRYRQIDIPRSDYLDTIAPAHIFADVLDLVGVQFFSLGNVIVCVIIFALFLVSPPEGIMALALPFRQKILLAAYLLLAVSGALFLYLAVGTTDRIKDRYIALEKYERKLTTKKVLLGGKLQLQEERLQQPRRREANG